MSGNESTRRGRAPVLGSSETAARLVILAVLALEIWLLVATEFLPFVDLPQHVAQAQLLAHRGEPEVARLYAFHLFPQVNILHLVVAAPLLRVLSEAVVVRLILAAYLTALTGGLFALTRTGGTSTWNVVLGLLFSLHFGLMYGFMSYCLGIPILLFLLARLGRTGGEGEGEGEAWAGGGWSIWRDGFLDAGGWILLALAHVLLWGFGIAALGLRLLLVRDRHWRRLTVAWLPSLLLVVAWFWQTRVELGQLSPGSVAGPGAAPAGLDVIWHGLGGKLEALGWALTVASRPGRVEWFLLAVVCAVVVVALVLERRGGSADPWHGSARAVNRRWLRLVALLAVALFLLLPSAISDRRFLTHGLFLLYQRFLILAPLALLPTLVWPRRPARSGARVACIAGLVVLSLVHLGHWHQLLGRVSRAADGLNEAIAAIPPGRIVKSLVYTPFPDGLRFASLLHVASYYQARKQGEVDQSFALLPVSPVHYRDAERPYLSRQDEQLYPERFDWRDARLYDYILLHDRRGEWQQFYARVPFTRLFQRNGWVVMDVDSARRQLEAPRQLEPPRQDSR